jgi:hypothetical protein
MTSPICSPNGFCFETLPEQEDVLPSAFQFLSDTVRNPPAILLAGVGVPEFEIRALGQMFWDEKRASELYFSAQQTQSSIHVVECR